jgi:hypothetical protein
MATGPKGQKRKADVIGNAVLIARIATGEADDAAPANGKDKAAQALGKTGGRARAEAMSAERRKVIAKKAALKLWSTRQS